MKCFFGFHDYRDLPWFWVRDESQMPHKICRRCHKLWYRYRPVLRITSAEGRRTPVCMYEGQWIAKGFESYDAMLAYRREGVKLLLRKMK